MIVFRRCFFRLLFILANCEFTINLKLGKNRLKYFLKLKCWVVVGVEVVALCSKRGKTKKNKTEKNDGGKKTCNKAILFMAVVSSITSSCNFGYSGKQCNQLIKHLRRMHDRVAEFMWARHLSSFSVFSASATGSGFTSTHIITVTIKLKGWAGFHAFRLWFTRLCACASGQLFRINQEFLWKTVWF